MDHTIENVPHRTTGGGVLNILAGAWLIVSPFALAFHLVPQAKWNNVATGIAIAAVAIIRMGAMEHPGWSWVNVLLGFWVILSPWVLGFSANGAMDLEWNSALVWNNVITGAIVAFLAVSGLLAGHPLQRVQGE